LLKETGFSEVIYLQVLGPTTVVNNNDEVAQLLPLISRLFWPKG
jgi:hypothetical protein